MGRQHRLLLRYFWALLCDHNGPYNTNYRLIINQACIRCSLNIRNLDKQSLVESISQYRVRRSL